MSLDTTSAPPVDIASTAPRPRVRRPSPRPRAPLGSDVVVVVALLIVALWRWGLLTVTPGPIGVDGGNWLRLAQAALGRIDIDDVVTPPLVPLLAGLIELLLGPLGTTRFLTVVGSIAPSAGAWWVLRRRRGDTTAVLATIALALVTPTAAATAWGGIPQLLGLGLLPPTVAAVVHAARAGTAPGWLRAGALAALVGLTSTLVTVLTGIAGAVAIVHTVLRGRAGPLRPIVIALAPLAPVATLYVVILTRMSLPDGRLTARIGTDALRAGLGDPFALWMGLSVLVALGAVLRRRDDDDAALVAGLVAAGIAGLVLGDTRFTAAIPSAVVVGVVLLPGALARGRALAVACLVVLAGSGVATQATQLGFYAQFTPATILEDAAIVAGLMAEGEVVATPPVAGAPTGWWLEAVGVDAAVASRSDWLSFPEERQAASRVVALFTAPRWPTPRTAAAACEEGFDALYVPDAWGGVDPSALAEELAEGRLRLVTELPGGVLLRSGAC